MKLWHLLVLAGIGAGAWWWWRRSGYQVPGFLAPPPPPPGYVPTPIPPATPGAVGGGWLDTAAGYGNQAIGKFGDVSQQAFTSLCGSGQACQAGATVANYAGQATAAITVKSVEYAAKGAKKVWDKIF